MFLIHSLLNCEINWQILHNDDAITHAIYIREGNGRLCSTIYRRRMASGLSTTSSKRDMSEEKSTDERPAKKNHWSVGLSSAMDDESVRVHQDELCTVIKDKYPKVGRRALKLEKISFEYDFNELDGSPS